MLKISRFELAVGEQTWPVAIAAERLRLQFPVFPTSPDLPAMLESALQQPIGLPAPLARAFTPDDRICLVVDERLPQLPVLLSGLLGHLEQTGIAAAQVVLLVTPPSRDQAWIDQLPDEFGDVQIEVHDPDDPQKLAYLATNRAGERLYLNRTALEAGGIIVLAGRRYDEDYGYLGAEVSLFPVLSNRATRDAWAAEMPRKQRRRPAELRSAAREAAWLAGLPLFVQPIEGLGDSILEIVAGLPECSAVGIARQNALWKASVPQTAELVVATLSGRRERLRFNDITRALKNAALCVQPGGRIILLTDAAPDLDELLEQLAQCEDLDAARQRLAKISVPDPRPARAWLRAADRARLSIASRYPAAVIESLHATPLGQPAELQRLIDQSDDIILLHDAHKCRIDR